jgi:hypothetical protein
MERKIYYVEELFQDIPDDPDNVLFTIPPEILKESNLVPGDNINIIVEDGCMIIKKA